MRLTRTALAYSLLLSAVLALTSACASTPRKALDVENAALASDGVSIRFRLAGREQPEPTIVLIHGFGCDATFWDQQIDHIAEKHSVVALDLPGHGKSGTDRMQGWTMEAFGDDVRAVCDEIGANTVILVGHSMGGPVMLEAARLMPDRVVSIIGVDTFKDVEKKMTEKELEELVAKWKADFKGTVGTMIPQFMFTPDADKQLVDSIVARVTTLRPDIGIAILQSMFRYDIAKNMDALTIPVRCINSSELQPTNVEAARRHAKDFDVQYMAKVGHFPMLEAPVEFNKKLDAAIAGRKAKAEKKKRAVD